MPALIEGMTQPSAPLMRRHDGTTMRDGVYEQMLADRNSGVAQSRNPPQSLRVFSSNEPTTNASIFAGPSASANQPTNPTTNVNMYLITSEFRDRASDVFLTAIESHCMHSECITNALF